MHLAEEGSDSVLNKASSLVRFNVALATEVPVCVDRECKCDGRKYELS
jgi:hypothetical protein